MLKLHHERRANEDPWGDVGRIRVQLKSTSKKAAYLHHTPTWKVSELTVLNTSDGSLASFGGTMGCVLGVEPVDLYISSDTDSASSSGALSLRLLVTTIVEDLWENQRHKRRKGFSAASLFASDPPPFSDGTGAPRYKESVDLPNPDPVESAGGISWAWLGDWELEATQDVDAEGWAYATHWSKAWHTEKGKKNIVRRRKWIRVRKATPQPAAGAEEGVPPESPA